MQFLMQLYERGRLFLTSEDVVRRFQAQIGSLPHEELWGIALDGTMRARKITRLARGSADGVLISRRDVMRFSLRAGGSSLVLVHNHPSGCPMPSAEDRMFTQVIRDAGELVGVPLIDHVIVTANDHVSFVAMGWLA